MNTRVFLSLLLIVPALLFAEIEVKVPSQEEGTGCYLIGNAEELYGFADVVKSSSSACGKLTANIVVNENVLQDNGLPVGCTDTQQGCAHNKSNEMKTLNTWTPMKSFSGVFDGNGYVISGLYAHYENGNNDIGLFAVSAGGSVENPAVIKNLGLVDSYIKGGERVGGFVGNLTGALKIENSYNEATILGNCYLGGFVGNMADGSNLKILNSYNKGKTFIGGPVGGFVGKVTGDNGETKLSIVNSYNLGEIKGDHSFGGIIGLVAGSHGFADVENSYTFYGAFVGAMNNGDTNIVHSFYVKDGATECVSDGGCPASAFSDGTILDTLKNYKTESVDGSIWTQDENSDHPYIPSNYRTLTWSSDADSVSNIRDTVAKYHVVAIAEGKQFYANGKIYSGILSDADVSAIGDSVLYPIGGISLKTENDKRIVTLDGDSVTALAFPSNFHADSVIFKRTFAEGVMSTVMFPFSAKVSGGTFYTFAGVTDSTIDGETVWIADWEEVAAESNLAANVPYMVVPSGNSLTIHGAINFTSEGLKKESVGNWDFNGPYTYRFFAETDEIGKAYGFASKTKTVGEAQVAAGTFVKAASGAKIRPLRGFLIYNPKTPSQNRPEAKFAPAATLKNDQLPSKIEIRLLKIATLDENNEDGEDLDEGTTSLVKVKAFAPKSADLWFDVNGRELHKKPIAKGTYFNNGKMVIIK